MCNVLPVRKYSAGGGDCGKFSGPLSCRASRRDTRCLQWMAMEKALTLKNVLHIIHG